MQRDRTFSLNSTNEGTEIPMVGRSIFVQYLVGLLVRHGLQEKVGTNFLEGNMVSKFCVVA